MNADLWVALILSIAVTVQLVTGVVWVPRRSLYERWRHGDDDDETLIWRSHDTFYYWFVIVLEAGATFMFWWRGFTGRDWF